MALSMLFDHAELNDHGVILEYQHGSRSTSRASPSPAERRAHWQNSHRARLTLDDAW